MAMNDSIFVAVACISVINIFTFALFAYDKLCAKKNWWRIRESTLLIWSAIGGALGAFLAMNIFHHKTLHLKFKLCVPIFLCIHILIVALIYTNPGHLVEKLLEVLPFGAVNR